jgi:predicted Zn-dependent protease
MASLLVVAMASRAGAVQLIDPPSGLAWSADEVSRVGARSAATVLARAKAAGELDCRTHCEAIRRVWLRLADAIAQQDARSQRVALKLHVVRSADVDAFATPDGTLVLSEAFVRRRDLDDAQLAFVIAHEAAHALLEHERQTLTAALALLPRNVPRTVDDVYVEFGFNIAVLRLLEPVMQQAELEADEVGLQLASLAGYPPQAQLRFLEIEAAGEQPAAAVVATHPGAASRLARLRSQLPLSDRIYELGVSNRTLAP